MHTEDEIIRRHFERYIGPENAHKISWKITGTELSDGIDRGYYAADDPVEESFVNANYEAFRYGYKKAKSKRY